MFNQVTIIGLGLLGGSFARDVRRLGLAKTIVGVARSEQTAKVALSEQVVDRVLDLHEAVKEADFVLVSTPMQSIAAIIKEISQSVSQDCIISDVGSVKGSLYAELKESCPEVLASVVLAHPIAGGEHSGVLASKNALFEGKHLIVTPTPEVDKDKVFRVKDLWQALGCDVVDMSLAQHDQVFAKTSHLPHMVAFALVDFLSAQKDADLLFDMAAGGFYDFTRIASSDAKMWRDICASNGPQISDSLEDYIESLKKLKALIDSEQTDALEAVFANSKSARDLGLSNKQKR